MGAIGGKINRLQKEQRVRIYFEFLVRMHTVTMHRHYLADTFPCTQEQTASRDESVVAMQSQPQKSVAAVQSPSQTSVAAMQSPSQKTVAAMQSSPQKSVAAMQSPPQKPQVSLTLTY